MYQHDTIEIRCEDYEDGGCSGPPTLGPCPYCEDINHKTILVWLCKAHQHERSMDI
jgi:hypothetical protein